MAKTKVTLTLDPETYSRFRAVVARLPGKFSLSAMVEQQLAAMVTMVEPTLDHLEAEPDRLKRAAMIRSALGGALLGVAGDLDTRTRALEEDAER